MSLALRERRAEAGGRLVFLGGDDRDRLNAVVASSRVAHYKQVYEWGEVLAYEGTRTVRLGVERDGELCASLAIYIRRIPRLNLTFLSGSRGPIVDFRDRRALECLLDGIKQLARQEGAIFLRVDPECLDDDTEAREALLDVGFRHLAEKRWSDLNDPRIVMRLDVTPPEPELFKGFRETHRRHIRGIAKKGISIRDALGEDDVARFRQIMVEVGERRGFPVRALGYYTQLWRHFIQANQGRLLLAEKGCNLMAGVLTVAVGRKAWLLYTGLTAAGRTLHPNEALWWEALRGAKRRGVGLFNFGGSGTDWPPQPDSPGYPIYSFKLGFAAEAVYFTGFYDLVFRPGLYRLFRLAEEEVLPRAAASRVLGMLIKR